VTSCGNQRSSQCDPKIELLLLARRVIGHIRQEVCALSRQITRVRGRRIEWGCFLRRHVDHDGALPDPLLLGLSLMMYLPIECSTF
jgi:hypothetical protein